MEEFQEQLDKIGKMPWRSALLGMAVGFVLASLLSLLIGHFILPTEKDLRIESNSAQDGESGTILDYRTETLTEIDIQQILDRNIFNSQGKFPEEDTQDEEGGPGIVESTLPLRLVGTISGGNPYIGIAIIENKEKNVVNSFMVTENIMESQNAILDEIYPQRIILTHNGRKEFIKLDIKNVVRISRKAKKGGGRSLASSSDSNDYYVEDGFERKGSQVRLTQSYKADLLGAQLQKVLKDAKADPRTGPDGRVNGWTMKNIKPDSIYQKMGIKEGDVVTEVNGYSLNDGPKAVKVLRSLQKEEKFKIRVERGGSSFDIDMGVE